LLGFFADLAHCLPEHIGKSGAPGPGVLVTGFARTMASALQSASPKQSIEFGPPWFITSLILAVSFLMLRGVCRGYCNKGAKEPAHQ
jgi:hypothetical protein